jgi:hypothetical protein
MGACHTAAALTNFVAMECHAVDFIEWWGQLVTGGTTPFIKDGYVAVPDAPGLGVELNEAVVKEHLRYPGYFEPNAQVDPNRPAGGPWPHWDVNGKWVNATESNY